MFWNSKNSYKKKIKTYNFDAFISYKQKYDQEVANILEHDIEHYRIPRKFRKEIGKKRLKVFLDKDELCVTNDLNVQIKKNLKNSKFLIVVCSPKAKTALWIKKEIKFFKSAHGNSDKNIIPVLIKDKIENAVPNMLIEKDEDGQVKRLVVPYKEKQERKKELPRIIATLIGCEYDDLVQRVEKEEKARRIVLTVAIVVVSMIFTAMFINMKNKEDNALREESENLALRSESAYDHYDREKAIENALKALCSKENKRPYVPEAKRALLTATEAYGVEKMEMGVIRNFKFHVPIKEYAVYEKGESTYISILGKDTSIQVYNIKTNEKVLDLRSKWEGNGIPDDVHIIMCDENQLLIWNSNYISSFNLDKKTLSWQKKMKIDNSREYINISYNSDNIAIGLKDGEIIILDKENGKEVSSVISSKVITKTKNKEPIFAKISPDGRYLMCYNQSCAYLYDRNKMKSYNISDNLQLKYEEAEGYIMGDFCILSYRKEKKKSIHTLCYDMKNKKIIFQKEKKNVKKDFYIPWFIPFENAIINGKNMDITICVIGNSMILINCQSGEIISEIQFTNTIQGAFLQKGNFINVSEYNFDEDVLTVIFENGECADYSFENKNTSESYKTFQDGIVHPEKTKNYFFFSCKNQLNEVKEDNAGYGVNFNVKTHQTELFADNILIYGKRNINTEWEKIINDFDFKSKIYPYKEGFLIFQPKSCIYYDVKKKSVVWENQNINHIDEFNDINMSFVDNSFLTYDDKSSYEYLGTENSEQRILIGSLEDDFCYKIQFLNDLNGKISKTDNLNLESFNNTPYKVQEINDFKKTDGKIFFSVKLEGGYGLIISYNLESGKYHNQEIKLRNSSNFIKMLDISSNGKQIFWCEMNKDTKYLNQCNQSGILDMHDGKSNQLKLDGYEDDILLTPNPCWSDDGQYIVFRSDDYIFIFSKNGDCKSILETKEYIFAGFCFFENILYVIGEVDGIPMLFRYDAKSGNLLSSSELKGRSGFDGKIFDIKCIKSFDSEVVMILNYNSFQGSYFEYKVGMLFHDAWIIDYPTGKEIAFIPKGVAYNQNIDYIFANNGIVKRYTTEELVKKASRMK